MRTAPHLCRPVEFLFPAYRRRAPVAGDAGRRASRSTTRWRCGARPRGSRRAARRASCYELAPLPAQRRAARARRLRRLPDRRRPPGAGERARRRGGRRDRRQSRSGDGPRSATLTAASRRRARGRRDRRAAGRARARSWSTPPARSRTPSPAAARRACARRWASTWCSTPRACRTDGAAFVLRSPRDSRLFFVLPAGPRTIVGTTDTDWPVAGAAGARPGRRHPRPRRRRRLPAGGRQPRLPAAAARGRATCCPPTPGCGRCSRRGADTPSADLARARHLAAAATACSTVAGGKLTTMRRMGEEAVDRALDVLRAAGLERRLGRVRRPRTARCPAAGPHPPALAAHPLADDVRAHVAAAYGARAAELLAVIGDVRPASRRASIPSSRTLGRGRVRRPPRARPLARRRAGATRAAVPRRARPGPGGRRRGRRAAGRRARLDAGARARAPSTTTARRSIDPGCWRAEIPAVT